MRLREWLIAAAWCAASFAASAQLVAADPDWKEQEASPPPAFDIARLIPLEVNVQSTLKYGVDPATISIGRDGIVRYVMVARSSSGTVNAMYEGLRCSSGEVRVYAHYNASSGWSRAHNGDWRSLWANHPSRHSLAFARQGGCMEHAPPLSVDAIVRSLRNQDYEKLR